ncbi:hypothetical protein BAMY_05860 [Bacillus amyloliquefaciens]|uniref:Uncharacterized protein n=1 Tax=Bacillus velezensis TaxID=492670 RepID=A0A6A8LFM4_BACVE|nr:MULTISPECIES: hypothetical protein [Bacillus]ALV00914.1 hypothetical protein AVM03_00505 [Bacillus amyloliquefaciens]APB81655.1 hypothetical protein BAMY_05860 [Bacillus amyloliquefaciens]AVX17839.1 hypothetical protein C5I45_13565 [Bacillus sp. ZY-1-1]AWM82641.1 hypothetical protein B7L90_05025 [Bacillus velezensis]MDF3256020.1 hypothetical protein [Bacillus velezensis]
MVNKVLRKINGATIFFILVLAFDLTVFLMSHDGYYLSFVVETNYIFPVLLTLVGFFVLARRYKILKLYVTCITIPVVLIVALLAATGDSYGTISSPAKNVTVTIEHRNATLGETNHFYDFYVHVPSLYPGLMRKVNKDTVYIMTRNTEGEDDLDVLGVGNAEWKDNKIIFHSAYEKAIEVDL